MEYSFFSLPNYCNYVKVVKIILKLAVVGYKKDVWVREAD